MRAAHVVRSECHEKTAAQVIAQHDGAQKLHARAAFTFRHGQRGGHGRAPGMCLGDQLNVIRFVGMPAHAVGQRGIDRGGLNVRPDY